MKRVIREYFTNEERDEMISEQTSNGLLLIEEQNISEGNFLIFGTEDDLPIPPIPEPTLEEILELKIAQNTVETLELISAQNELQKIEQAQSNAELIELMMMIGGM